MVNVPAGIDDGQTICLRGEGEAGMRGGARGDLYVTIRIKPHRTLQRDGYDLRVEQAIPFTVAALGGEILVPSLNGSVKCKIPAGTQSGATLRLREQGIQRLNASGKGDMLVTVVIEVPKKLSEEQKNFLEQFAASMGEKQSRPSVKKSFFGKK
jgi:molecular chaperone DnaJ